jgi:hypothetical protein
VSILNAALRVPQAVYLLRLKPNDWSALLKYCADIVGNPSSQRCVTSLAITAALRFMNCDPSSITISKCLLWHHPSKADHLFLSDKQTWSDSQSLELAILTPFINSCIPPQLALVFATRMLAVVCDMDAPKPSEDNPSALRLPSLVSLFVGYASLVHLKAPINWIEHAKGVMTFWGARVGVDSDRVIAALKVTTCSLIRSLVMLPPHLFKTLMLCCFSGYERCVCAGPKRWIVHLPASYSRVLQCAAAAAGDSGVCPAARRR